MTGFTGTRVFTGSAVQEQSAQQGWAIQEVISSNLGILMRKRSIAPLHQPSWVPQLPRQLLQLLGVASLQLLLLQQLPQLLLPQAQYRLCPERIV